MLALAIDTANLPSLDRFPEYFEPVDDTAIMPSESPKPKALTKLIAEDESRGPSPQPTHFSVPLLSRNNSNGHRILRSATVGYIAPEFKGKVEQMKTGESN